MSVSYNGAGDFSESPASPYSPGLPLFEATGSQPEPEQPPVSPTAAYLAPQPTSRWGRTRRRFRNWRRTRPFWGGLLILLAGAEISLTVKAPMRVVVHVGLQGLAGYAIPVIMVLCGLLLWFSPGQRLFYSVIAVLLALSSWLTSNLGGFVLGMLLGLVGGSLAFGWTPNQPGKDVKSG